MNKARIAGTLVLVFLAGVATGMVAMRLAMQERGVLASATTARNDGSPAVLEHFRKELDLTETQTQQLAAILDDYREYYDSLREQIEDLHLRDQIEDLRSTGKNRIVAILTPEQRVKFEKMTDELNRGLPGSDSVPK